MSTTTPRSPSPSGTTSRDVPAPDSSRDEPAPLAHAVVQLRPVASPTSIGLYGLAVATLVLAGLQLGWVAQQDRDQVGLVLIAFAALAQLLASVIAFGARDGVVSTVMAVLALTWLSTGLVLLTSQPGTQSVALGLLLLCSAVAVALCGLTATASKLAAAAVFLTAALRIGLTSAYQLSGASWLQTLAGVLGLVLAVLAVVVAWASEEEDARGRSPVPLGRRAKGLRAVRGTLSEQTRDLATEAGVRSRL